MIFKVAMPTFAMGLAFCLSLPFTLLGCGGTQETGYRPTLRRPEGPTAPEATVTQLTDCTKQGASRLTDTHYAILFDVNVTQGGDVGMVKIKDSMIGDREIEACMVRALEGMSLPSSITATRSSQPISRGMGAESRALMGNAGVLGAAVSFVPIVIVVAGVTILVLVTLYGVDEIAEAIRRRPKKVENKCYPRLYQCLETPDQPEWNRNKFGDRKQCEACFYECIKDNGEWPSYKCPPPDYRPN